MPIYMCVRACVYIFCMSIFIRLCGLTETRTDKTYIILKSWLEVTVSANLLHKYLKKKQNQNKSETLY